MSYYIIDINISSCNHKILCTNHPSGLVIELLECKIEILCDSVHMIDRSSVVNRNVDVAI